MTEIIEGNREAETPGGRGLSRLTSLPVRMVVTAALLAAVALSIDWGEVGTRLRDGSWGWFAAAVAILVVALVVGALRWHILLRAAGVQASLGQTIRAYFIGSFANNFLPTGFGGDIARAAVVAPQAGLARALTTVTVDRLTAIGCLMLLGLLMLAVDGGSVPEQLQSILVAASAAGGVGLALVIGSTRSRGLMRVVPVRLRSAARIVRDTLTGYIDRPGVLLATVALGLVYQALVVLCTVWLGRAVNLDLSYALVAVVVPLVLIVTLVPISIAGFGLREGSFVALLGTASVAAGAATILSLLSVAAMAVASLPGAIVILLPRPPG